MEMLVKTCNFGDQIGAEEQSTLGKVSSQLVWGKQRKFVWLEEEFFFTCMFLV
jgi:hypothetical protein